MSLLLSLKSDYTTVSWWFKSSTPQKVIGMINATSLSNVDESKEADLPKKRRKER